MACGTVSSFCLVLQRYYLYINSHGRGHFYECPKPDGSYASHSSRIAIDDEKSISYELIFLPLQTGFSNIVFSKKGFILNRIPVLAGGGAIGAGYATPYMTMEGTPSPMYFSQPAAQPPTFRPAG